MRAFEVGAGPSAVVVRPAVAADVEAVAGIERASFGDPWSEASFRSLPADPRVCFAVAEEQGAVVGYVVTWFVLDEAELANIAVARVARGRGIGAALLEAALADARARGVRRIYLEVRESNHAARALYAHRGFTELARRRRYYRAPVEDAVVMRLVLGSVEGK